MKIRNLFFMLCVAMFFICPVVAEESIDNQIENERHFIDEIGQARNELGQILDQIIQARGKSFEAFILLQQVKELHAKKLAQMETNLRQLRVKAAKLTAPYDLAEAWKNYKKSRRTQEDFKNLFEIVRGTQPDNATLQNYGIHEKIIEREIRNKIVMPLGLALLELGKLLTKFVQMTAWGANGMIHPRNAHIAAQKFETRGAIAEFFKKSIENFFGKPGLVVYNKVPFIKTGFYLLKDLAKTYISGRLIPKSALNYLKSFKSKSAEEAAYFVPFFGTMLAKARTQDYADSMIKRAYQETWGTDDRAKAEAEIAALIKDLEEAIPGAKEKLALGDNAVSEAAASLTDFDKEIQRVQASFVEYDREVDRANKKIAVLEEEKNRKAVEVLVAANGGGKAFPAAVSIKLEHEKIAGDELTAKYLKLPRQTAVKVETELQKPDAMQVKYYADTTDGRQERITTIRTIKDLGRITGCPDGKIVLSGAARQGDSGKFFVAGDDAGSFALKFQAYGIVDREELKNDYYTQIIPKFGQVESETLFGHSHKIEGIQIGFEKPNEESSDEINLFAVNDNFSINGLNSSAKTVVNLKVTDGSKTYSVNPKAPMAVEIEDSTIAFIRNEGNGVFVFNSAGKQGQTRCGFFLESANGQKYHGKKLKVNCSLLSKDQIRPYPYDMLSENRIPTGIPFYLRFIAQGPVPMSDYRVEWRAENSHGIQIDTGKSFVARDGKFVWECALTYLEGRTTPVEIKARLIDKSGNMVAETDFIGPDPAIMIDDLRWVLVGQNTVNSAGAEIRFFSPSTLQEWQKVELGIELTTSSGQKIIEKPFAFELSGGSTARQFFNEYRGKFERNQQAAEQLRSDQIESAPMLVRLSPFLAAKNNWFIRNNEILEDTLQISFNKMVARRISDDNGDRFRMEILGKSDLSGFSAKWLMSDGSEIVNALETDGGRYCCELEDNGRVNGVALLDKPGNEVAKYVFNASKETPVLPQVDSDEQNLLSLTGIELDGIAIERVRHISGNNPFSAVAPITNTDGGDRVAKDSGSSTTPVTPVPPPPDQPTSPPIDLPSAPVGVFGIKEFAERTVSAGLKGYFAGIELDSNTGIGYLRNDGAGNLLILRTPETGAGEHTGKVELFPDRGWNNGGQGDWDYDSDKMSNPAPLFFDLSNKTGETRDLYLKAKNGVKVRVRVTVYADIGGFFVPKSRAATSYRLWVQQSEFYK